MNLLNGLPHCAVVFVQLETAYSLHFVEYRRKMPVMRVGDEARKKS